MPRPKRDPKTETLRQRGSLNPHPERVRDELFRQTEFFDARDLLQAKYEMVRRVHVDGASVVAATETFGLSRPSFYAAQAAIRKHGLGGLLPHKRGPHGGHKLTPEIMKFVQAALVEAPRSTASVLAPLIKERFGVSVHARTVERAVARQKKRRR